MKKFIVLCLMAFVMCSCNLEQKRLEQERARFVADSLAKREEFVRDSIFFAEIKEADRRDSIERANGTWSIWVNWDSFSLKFGCPTSKQTETNGGIWVGNYFFRYNGLNYSIEVPNSQKDKIIDLVKKNKVKILKQYGVQIRFISTLAVGYYNTCIQLK